MVQRELLNKRLPYYPYGGIIADLGSGNFLQPFLFGGKELISANGIHEYDLGARRYWTGAPQFTTIDKLCEEFYWLSPYLYCGNNPVNAVDRDGNFFDTIWDIGNIAYDVGAAIVNHVKGDHTAAASNWMDAAFDTAAAIVPFVPAGASKIGKAAKTIDKVSDAKSAEKGLKNAAAIKEGKEFEKQTAKKIKDQGKDIAEQVTLVPLNGDGNVAGNRIRADIIINEKDGTKTLVEIKRSSSTKLSKGQQKAFDHIINGNKQFEVRSNKWPYKKNDVITIDNWQRIDKYKN